MFPDTEYPWAPFACYPTFPVIGYPGVWGARLFSGNPALGPE